MVSLWGGQVWQKKSFLKGRCWSPGGVEVGDCSLFLESDPLE